MKTMDVLLVDDSLPIRKMLTNIIKSHHHRVLTACHGAEALEMVAERRVSKWR